MNFTTSRKACEWCTNARHLLLYVAREVNFHHSSVADVQLDYYCRKSCGEVEVGLLMILLQQLFSYLKEQELKSFNTCTKYWEILNLVMSSYKNGYPPPYKKYIN